MNGSVFLNSQKGLYASNDADMNTHRNIIKDEEGKAISSSHTNVIQIMHYMCISGNIEKDDLVDCLFKFDENEEVQSFTGIISGKTDEMLILNLKARTLRNKEITETIKKKIKEEISYGS